MICIRNVLVYIRIYMLPNGLLFVVSEDNRPLWVKALMPFGIRNVVDNMSDMEKYLVENCTDLDYTAIKLCFGKGQNKTGLKYISQ